MHADEHQCVEKVTDREFIKAKKEEKLKSTKKRPQTQEISALINPAQL